MGRLNVKEKAITMAEVILILAYFLEIGPELAGQGGGEGGVKETKEDMEHIPGVLNGSNTLDLLKCSAIKL